MEKAKRQSKDNEKRVILILGMHRSGTSAIAGALRCCGLPFGDNLLMGLSDNPKGHFENRAILHLNESILADLGSSWSDPRPLKPNFDKYSEKTVQVIKNEFNGYKIFGLKDPRLALLLPLYIKAFKEVNIEPSFVVIKRDKSEVAASLKARNGFSREKSLALFKKYSDSIDKYLSLSNVRTKKQPNSIAVIQFADLIKKPQKTVSQIIKQLNLPLKYNKEVEKFLDSNLKHYNKKSLANSRKKGSNVVKKHNKVKTKPKPAVFFWVLSKGGCTYYRCYLPARVLSYTNYARGVAVHYDPRLSRDFDIIVSHNPTQKEHLDFLKYAKDHGKKIVIESDDDLFHVMEKNPAFNYYADHRNRQHLEIFSEALELADAVTVATEPLKASYSRFNDNIYVIPNCLDEEVLHWQRRQASIPIVGWQGGSSHEEDLRVVRGLINELCQKRDDFSFVVSGMKPQGFKKLVFRKPVPPDSRLLHYNLFNDFAIGICPLAKTHFNECKSDLKFLEYGSLGIPSVASKFEPYKTIKHGQTGFLARNSDDWRKYITMLLDDEELRLKIGKAAKEYIASQRTIQDNIWRWAEIYQNL